MALFRNPPPASGRVGVKLRGYLCDVLKYVSAQPLVFLDLAKKYPFMKWKLTMPIVQLMDGRQSSYTPVD
jgi:hypothetical protein